MQWQGNDKDVVQVTNLCDDESFAKMSGGDVDVEPYLYSRNTIGHGNHNPKSQRPKRAKIVIGGIVVVVVVDEEAIVPKYPKHLGRLTSPLKQPQMLNGVKWVRLRKATVVLRMIWWKA